MTKKVVIIYGPPGSGKGTQANLLASRKNLIHFDTGKFVEALTHDPATWNDKIIARERKLFDTGMLMTPSFVLGAVKKRTKEIAKSGMSVVYSASPRTLYEAFGEGKVAGLISVLEKLYGKKNISVVRLKTKPETSIKRNSARFVCTVCENPVIAGLGLKSCPICLGKLRTRTLDKPGVIKVRLKEYDSRTAPILIKLKNKGYRLIEVNGDAPPYRVYLNIFPQLKI